MASLNDKDDIVTPVEKKEEEEEDTSTASSDDKDDIVPSVEDTSLYCTETLDDVEDGCVDISKIHNRDELLQALWENSVTANFFTTIGFAPTWNLERAKKEILFDGSADYVLGRVIKCNIYKKNIVDPWRYDRDSGEGAFKKVVDQVLEKQRQRHVDHEINAMASNIASAKETLNELINKVD